MNYVLEAPGATGQIGPERGRPVRDGIARYVSPHGSHRYVLYEAGVPLAGIQVMTRDGRHGVIAYVFTLPERRRQGLAAKLLARARRDFARVDHAEPGHLTDLGRAWKAGMGENPGRGREHGDPRARLARAREVAEAGDRDALAYVYLEGLRQGAVPRQALEALTLFNDPVALQVTGEVVPELSSHHLRADAWLRTDAPTLSGAARESVWRWAPRASLDRRAWTYAAVVAKAAFEAAVVDVAALSETVEAVARWWVQPGGDLYVAPPAELHAAVVRDLGELHRRMVGQIALGPMQDDDPTLDRIHGELLPDLASDQAAYYWSAVGPTTTGDARRRLGYGVAAIEAVVGATLTWTLRVPNAHDPGTVSSQVARAVDQAWAARNVMASTVMGGREAVESHLRANLRPWVLDGCPGPWPRPRAVEALAAP